MCANATNGKYTTAEAWLKAVTADPDRKSVVEMYPHCRDPMLENFYEETQFDLAMQLCCEHNRKYHSEYRQKPEVHSRNNELDRERWARNKDSEEGRTKNAAHIKRIDANKKKKSLLPLEEGFARCSSGQHVSPLSQFMFCPVADLGITDFQGVHGCIQRSICKRHFLQRRITNLKSKEAERSRK